MSFKCQHCGGEAISKGFADKAQTKRRIVCKVCGKGSAIPINTQGVSSTKTSVAPSKTATTAKIGSTVTAKSAPSPKQMVTVNVANNKINIPIDEWEKHKINYQATGFTIRETAPNEFVVEPRQQSKG